MRLPAPRTPTPDGFPCTVPVGSQLPSRFPGTVSCSEPGCEWLHVGLSWQLCGQRPLTVAHEQSCICLFISFMHYPWIATCQCICMYIAVHTRENLYKYIYIHTQRRRWYRL